MSRNIKLLEPEWDYVGGGCTCPPTVAGQVWRDDGAWERKDASGQRVFVRVEIVKAASIDATVEYMRRFGTEGSSCRVKTYELGDEGFLLTCPQTFKSQLSYRKGPFLVRVLGDSQTLVERFAKYALKVVPAT